MYAYSFALHNHNTVLFRRIRNAMSAAPNVVIFITVRSLDRGLFRLKPSMDCNFVFVVYFFYHKCFILWIQCNPGTIQRIYSTYNMPTKKNRDDAKSRIKRSSSCRVLRKLDILARSNIHTRDDELECTYIYIRTVVG